MMDRATEVRHEALDAIEHACMSDEISVTLLEQANVLDAPGFPFAARARFLHGNVRYRLDQDDLALAYFQQAEQMAREEDDQRTLTLAVIRQVEWAAFHEQWAEMKARWPDALALADAFGEPYQRARTRQTRGMLAEESREWDESSRWFEQAAALYQEAALRQVTGAGELANKYASRARSMRWRAHAERGETLPEDAPVQDRDDLAEAYARIAQKAPTPEESLTAARVALRLGLTSTEHRAELVNCCLCWLLDVGDLAGAWRMWQDLRDLSETGPISEETRHLMRFNEVALLLVGNSPLTPEQEHFLLSEQSVAFGATAAVHLNRSLLWVRRGVFERALEEQERGLAFVAGQNEPARILTCTLHQMRAHTLALLDRHREAVDELELAKEQATLMPPVQRAGIHMREGILWRMFDDFDQAFSEFCAAFKMVEDIEPMPAIGPLALGFACICATALEDTEQREKFAALVSDMLTEPGEDAETMPLFMSLLHTARAIEQGDGSDLVQAGEYALRAQFLTDAVDHFDSAALFMESSEEAVHWSRRAAALLDESLSLAPDDESRVGMVRRLRHIRGRLVGWLWESSPGEALLEAVWAKSAALLSLLSMRWTVMHDEVSLPCSSVYASAAVEQVLAQSGDQVALRAGPPAPVDIEVVRSLYRTLTATDRAAVHLERERVASLEAIHAAMPAGTALIELFSFGGVLYSFVLRDGRVQSTRHEFPDDIDEVLTSLHTMLRDGTGGRMGRRVAQAALRRLHQALVVPWLPLVADVSRLFLCPGGRLAAVPFAALEAPDGGVLLERFELTFLLSSAQLPLLVDRGSDRRGTGMALTRGVDGERPLPCGDDELAAIHEMARGKGWRVEHHGPGASLFDVERSVREADVWHFTGHAGFVEQSGMAAYLATPERPWAAAELMGLDLGRVRLCVLSACETGRGSEDAGDEIVGLLRALFAAGIETIVCSNWPAEDASTARLTRLFYESWFEGERASSALRRAQLALRKEAAQNPDSERPWGWANFSVYGRS